jgi:hypothetical protein
MAKISVRNVQLLDYIAQRQSQRKANPPRPKLNFSIPCREPSPREEHTNEMERCSLPEVRFGAFDSCRWNLSGRMATSLNGLPQLLYDQVVLSY